MRLLLDFNPCDLKKLPIDGKIRDQTLRIGSLICLIMWHQFDTLCPLKIETRSILAVFNVNMQHKLQFKFHLQLISSFCFHYKSLVESTEFDFGSRESF